MLGIEAITGKAVAEIANEVGISRQSVYNYKDQAIQHIDALDEIVPTEQTITLDKAMVERIIVVLSLCCQSSSLGIQDFFEHVCGMKVSVGRISGVLKEASKRARAFDDGVDLSEINQIAIDEIFQCGKPILTGIDPISTYTFQLEESTDRSSESWALYLSDKQDKGLNPEVSINDGGLGLMSAIPQVFPKAEIQADTFHALYTLGKEVSKMERKANKLIANEHVLNLKLEGKRPREKHKASLEELRPKVAEAIDIYDKVFILYSWLKMLLSFSGYSLIDSHILAEWVLQEMDILAVNSPLLQKEIAKVRKLLPSLLSFVGRLERGIEVIACKTGVSAETYKLMYRQMSHSHDNSVSIEARCKLAVELKGKYLEAQNELQKLLDYTKKASSLVENLNGRIRVYIEVKRIIPTDFFVLLKVYFNTRRYRRSRCEARIRKSPLELLTNRTQPDFLEALGF